MGTFWQGKRVFLTGHTGFKGSWLSLWLKSLGAEVIGYSLDIPSVPSLFEIAHIGDGMKSLKGDILDSQLLQKKLSENKPDILIHMAAQSLVRPSYQNPLETLSTNIIGTANVLEAARFVDSIRVIICVTSDKCYENQEWLWGYRENDPMGGIDPYSCSKGCAELVIASYRRSFFSSESAANVASVRAGNVIGGGDWAIDRIIPDSVRAITQGKPIPIRHPNAIRPWQHVLEPLAGYLRLATNLWEDGANYNEGWNFGPDDNHAVPVGTLVEMLCNSWGEGAHWAVDNNTHPREANMLRLDSSKAIHRLGWRRVLTMNDTVHKTISWYKKFYNGEDPKTITLEQIEQYQTLLKENQDA
ncbi:MAG: CDP-glucose 4,6-dehydratase [Syntrophomonas sp.]